MTRLVFDTEFIEDGRTIDLLSIGVVREDGSTYYAESAEADRRRANPWVQENVLPYLVGPVKSRSQIAADLVAFAGDRPEWWAYYADYDWVALCQIYGRMLDLPGGWPMYCRDIKQEADRQGVRLVDVIGEPEQAHNALSDAQWGMEALRWLDARDTKPRVWRKVK